MGKKSNIIEINGRRYDAHTGEPLDGRANEPIASTPVTDVTPPNQPVVAPAPAHTAARVKTVSKTRVHDAIKAKDGARQRQHSQTLMRSAVSKPKPALKRHTKAQSHVDSLLEQPAAHLERKHSVRHVDDKRLQRASQIARSQTVNRFSRPQGPEPEPPVHLPARQPKPAEFPASHLSPAPQPQAPPRDSHSLDELVEHALEQATSHLELPQVSTRRRLFWRTSA